MKRKNEQGQSGSRGQGRDHSIKSGGTTGGGSMLKILLGIGVLIGVGSAVFYALQAPQADTREPLPSAPVSSPPVKPTTAPVESASHSQEDRVQGNVPHEEAHSTEPQQEREERSQNAQVKSDDIMESEEIKEHGRHAYHQPAGDEIPLQHAESTSTDSQEKVSVDGVMHMESTPQEASDERESEQSDAEAPTMRTEVTENAENHVSGNVKDDIKSLPEPGTQQSTVDIESHSEPRTQQSTVDIESHSEQEAQQSNADTESHSEQEARQRNVDAGSHSEENVPQTENRAEPVIDEAVTTLDVASNVESQGADEDTKKAGDSAPVNTEQETVDQASQVEEEETPSPTPDIPSKASEVELSPVSEQEQRMEAKIQEMSEKANLTCEQWMEQARELMTRGESSYSAALDTLAMCVFQEPSNAAAMWNMAVLLIKMNRTSESLVQMENAIAADPKNKEFRRGAGSMLFSMGAYVQAIKALETYLELNLFTDSWQKMMEDIYWQREDELVFLRDADDYDVTLTCMNKLLRCYLELRQLRQADRMYQILITLQPHDHEMMESYATFAFGLGNLWNGVRFMKIFMEHQFYHSNMGTMDEAYEVMTAHMLRLATSGFDAHIVNLARSLFLAGSQAAEMIREGCGADLLSDFTESTHTLKQTELVNILGNCIVDQQLVSALLEAGASKVANNIFGWSSLLHGVNLGHSNAFEGMVEAGMDVSHRTLLGMTALHVAALRGHSNLVPTILKAGVQSDHVDEYGRSAMAYACELRYAANDFSSALNIPAPSPCPTPIVKTGSSPLQAAAGEWLDSYRSLPESLTTDACDIDSIPGDTLATDFFRDYLSIQKPVIIRHGLTNWAALKTKLHRHSLDREHGSLKFKRSTVPYAETFGLDYEVTTLHEYLGYLSQLPNEEKRGSAPEKADYIFSSLGADHPLRTLFEIPASLDPNSTHISTRNVQFYVGPSLTGAPPHFHNFAWNGLVYGAKRWFIFPPQQSIYTRQPVMDWYRSYVPNSAFECTQHAGDVLVVPAMWAHAVINLKESIGFASEFTYGAAEFSL